jgi:hypothetical protein
MEGRMIEHGAHYIGGQLAHGRRNRRPGAPVI